jgi:hypothetical protein
LKGTDECSVDPDANHLVRTLLSIGIGDSERVLQAAGTDVYRPRTALLRTEVYGLPTGRARPFFDFSVAPAGLTFQAHRRHDRRYEVGRLRRTWLTPARHEQRHDERETQDDSRDSRG